MPPLTRGSALPELRRRSTIRDGAWVAELTGMLNLAAWPKGIRVIVRKERQHPGAQLRLTDIDGHRLTCFAASTRGGQLADLWNSGTAAALPAGSSAAGATSG